MYHQGHRTLNGNNVVLIVAMMVNSVGAVELKNVLLSREVFERPNIHTHYRHKPAS